MDWCWVYVYVCVRLLVLVLGWGSQGGGEGIRRRLVVFKTCVWPGKPGEALWGHPLPLYKLRAVPAGARAEPNEWAYWPVTQDQSLCRSPCNPGEGTADLWGSHSSSSSCKAAGDSWLSSTILHKLDLTQTIPKINSWFMLKFVPKTIILNEKCWRDGEGGFIDRREESLPMVWFWMFF